jgi:hypothetical protein
MKWEQSEQKIVSRRLRDLIFYVDWKLFEYISLRRRIQLGLLKCSLNIKVMLVGPCYSLPTSFSHE